MTLVCTIAPVRSSEDLDEIRRRGATLDSNLIDHAVPHAHDEGLLGRLHDCRRRHPKRGGGPFQRPFDGGEHAGRELAGGIVDIELDGHRSRPRVDGMGDAFGLAAELFARPGAHAERRDAAVGHFRHVALGDRDSEAQASDLLDAKHRGLVARRRTDEGAGVNIALGDDTVERRAQDEILLERAQ
jgi:hypothetical protein